LGSDNSKGVPLDFEDEIIDYLKAHGNTRESDLTEFATHNLQLTSKTVHEKLNKTVREGWISRIIHTKLKTPAIYVTLKESVLYDLMELWTKSLNPQKKDKKTLREKARKILEARATPRTH
jgi:hypothetical protein